MHDYHAKDLERRLNIPPAIIRSLIRAGHLRPLRRCGRLTFSFQDLVVLRTVSALRAASIAPHKINRALKKLKEALPTSPLSGQSLLALGDRIGVRDGSALWESDTGQYTFEFDSRLAQSEVRDLGRYDPAARAQALADDYFAMALEFESKDISAAETAYKSCLAADPGHARARLNLGRMLHLNGRLADAEAVYAAAAVTAPLLAFNLGVLFEDLDRELDAMLAYREAIALDATFADAHFNLARLHERAGNLKESFSHLLTYQRIKDRQER